MLIDSFNSSIVKIPHGYVCKIHVRQLHQHCVRNFCKIPDELEYLGETDELKADGELTAVGMGMAVELGQSGLSIGSAATNPAMPEGNLQLRRRRCWFVGEARAPGAVLLPLTASPASLLFSPR